MDPRRVLTFRAVAHERSFSKAAAKMSLTQPSVSHQIGLLETELGVRLLNRGRGGLRLTRAGEVLLEHADQIAWRLELADTQIAELSGERREQVRLGAFPTALASFVPSAIVELRRAQPDVRVLLGEVTPSTLEARLLSGQFDVVVSYQDAADERRELPGVERIDLLQETFSVGLPPGHLLARAAGPLSLTQLAGENWIVPSLEGFLVQACRELGFEPRVMAISGGDPLVTRGLIARGLGVGWVPGLLVGDSDGIVTRPIEESIRRRDIYALLPPGDRHPLARHVIAALHATAEANAAFA